MPRVSIVLTEDEADELLRFLQTKRPGLLESDGSEIRDSIERSRTAQRSVMLEMTDARAYALAAVIGVQNHNPQWSRLRAVVSKIEAARGRRQ